MRDIYNLDAKSKTAGDYTLTLRVSDIQVLTVAFALK
jgi:hypothetical protein